MATNTYWQYLIGHVLQQTFISIQQTTAEVGYVTIYAMLKSFFPPYRIYLNYVYADSNFYIETKN